MDKTGSRIERRIWLFWHQGLSGAPFVVRKCIDSWIARNPTWTVVVLDSSNVGEYVNLDLPDNVTRQLSMAHVSDLIRLLLLSKYGGVWADATTFCVQPLDEWIDAASASGFFAFHKPGRDRLMSNWFMAAEKNCPLTVKLYDQLKAYWMAYQFNRPTRIQRLIISILARLLNRSDKTTKHWFNPIVTSLFRVYPYFVFHYMFERLVVTDSECKAIWDNTRKVSADLPHLVQRLGFFSDPSSSAKEQIRNSNAPLFKLMWKYDHSRYSSNTLLHFLLEESAE